MKVFGPKSIKHYVGEYIRSKASALRGKVVIDIPAGNGVSSAILFETGADVRPMDLFPELFTAPGITCLKADLSKTIPLGDGEADAVLCQEGIEHLSDQLHAFREFNRVLKPGGELIITTPNYSNLKSRLSYLLAESEYAGKLMPPNEIDSIWFSGPGNNEVYFGHIFLLGVQRLRLMAKLTGFEIDAVIPVRLGMTSLILFPIIYPFIILVNLYGYLRAVKKSTARPEAKKIYREQLRYSVSSQILLDQHLFITFRKQRLSQEAIKNLRPREREKDFIT